MGADPDPCSTGAILVVKFDKGDCRTQGRAGSSPRTFPISSGATAPVRLSEPVDPGTCDMSETTSPDLIARRLDGLQNSIAGLSRRMITLEAGVNDRIGAVEARMAGLEDCADQLVERISALETRVNCLILLVERIVKP